MLLYKHYNDEWMLNANGQDHTLSFSFAPFGGFMELQDSVLKSTHMNKLGRLSVTPETAETMMSSFRVMAGPGTSSTLTE